MAVRRPGPAASGTPSDALRTHERGRWPGVALLLALVLPALLRSWTGTRLDTWSASAPP